MDKKHRVEMFAPRYSLAMTNPRRLKALGERAVSDDLRQLLFLTPHERRSFLRVRDGRLLGPACRRSAASRQAQGLRQEGLDSAE